MSKKKIAIVTFSYMNYNYGGVLQAYALSKVLENMGHKVELISYKNNRKDEIINRRWENFKKCKSFRAIKKYIKNKIRAYTNKNKESEKLELRKEYFNQFANKRLNQSEVAYSGQELMECYTKYDAFVCGSDQIWNPNILNPVYFLGFVPDEIKKIAYAPSLGVSKISPKKIQLMKSLIERIDKISVREFEGKRALEKYINKNIEVVLDPTLLIQPIIWDSICAKTDISKPYILCYFLGINIQNEKFVKKFAEEKELVIVSLFHEYSNSNFADINYPAGPEEFLNLIRNAEYVFTDSYHGSIFSIIFKKNFFIFMRDSDKNINSMNSRIHTLTSSLGINNRIINLKTNIKECINEEEIDYKLVTTKLEIMKIKSIDFLRDAID
ncbi:MAG: polysaccharide pyruvyl transferase family protein [Clostridiaceae bacterium]